MKFKELSSGPANLLKLKNGESVRGVFRGDIVDFKQHWGNSQGSTICTGNDCALCKDGERPAFRFRVNFIIQENGVYTAKVLEQGRRVYNTLKALHEGDYNLEEHAMKITRYGSTKDDTTYSILPVPNGKITKEIEKLILSVKLNDLSAKEISSESDGEEED